MDAVQSLHPTDQALGAYGLGKLDDASSEAVDRHLEGCADCRRRIAELSSDSFLARARDAQQPANELPPGLADHPDYQVKRELGRGGMGVVYLVHNRLLGRDEVLKVMSGSLMDRPGVRDRFLREVRAVARLRHPNIVTAYAAVRLGDAIALAMEYVDGLDLARLVRSKGPLPVAHACYFAHQAALGLQHAHEEGTVHRDVKPGNLMLARKGDRAVVKLLDFGLSRAASERGVDGALTHAGQMLGTPDFIAPEQTLDAQKADIRADIYSLGCTLYYLLTGSPPFQGAGLYDILQAHHSMDAQPLDLARADVPADLAALVAKMMAKDPARRFQTPGEVARALVPFYKKPAAASPVAEPRWEALLTVGGAERAPTLPPVPAPPPSPPRRRVSRAIAAAGGVVGLVALLGVIVIIRHKDGSESKIVLNDVKSITIEQTPEPPQPAAAPPATEPAVPEPVPPAADRRRLWVGTAGDRFEHEDGDRWHEHTYSNYDFYWTEVGRTDEYVELQDPSRYGGGYVRLFGGRAEVKWQRDPAFREFRRGAWDMTAPAPGQP